MRRDSGSISFALTGEMYYYYSMKVKIALIQFDATIRDVQGNLDRALEVLDGLPSDTDLAVLPEMFTTGFDYDCIQREAEPLEGAVVEALSRAARKKDIWLVGGSLPERDGDCIYNTAVLLDSDGEIEGFYRKAHLFPLMGEDTHLCPGEALPVFSTPFGTLGIQICYDLRFPEITRALALEGATLIVQPAQFPYPRLDHWKILTRARALENQVYFAAVNRSGEDESGHYFGHSVLVDPWGNPVVEGGEEEATLIGEADFDLVDRVRTKIPCFNSRRTDLYG